MLSIWRGFEGGLNFKTEVESLKLCRTCMQISYSSVKMLARFSRPNEGVSIFPHRMEKLGPDTGRSKVPDTPSM